MKLVPLKVDTIRVKEPLPFALRDSDGTLLANRGFVIDSEKDLRELIAKGRGLYAEEGDSYLRAYMSNLNRMLFQDRAIGDIASQKITRNNVEPEAEGDDKAPPDWPNLQAEANTMLRDNASPFFMERLHHLERRLQRYLKHNPDGTLLALLHLATHEVFLYSASHSMLVSCMCNLAAREVLNWPEDMLKSLMRASLTMNIGMTELQDRLARQVSPLTAEQRKQVDVHANRSVQLLKGLGISDPDWLEAVRDHHATQPGPLAGKTPAQRIARLIQRADSFGARLAPRASRTPTSPAAAMQASYFDENRQVDEAGAALIKAIGIYSPGTYVRLATNEVAMVVRRGLVTSSPRVAVLINREGMPMIDPIIRDTALHDYRVVASVPTREVKLKISLNRILPLSTGSDRLW